MQRFQCLDNQVESALKTECVKEEPDCEIEDWCDVTEQSDYDLYCGRVKTDLFANPALPIGVMNAMPGTCLVEAAIKEEPVGQDIDTESALLVKCPDQNGHSRELEVHVIKESCSSPTLDELIVVDEELDSNSSVSNHLIIHDKDKTNLNKINCKSQEQETFTCKICGMLFPCLSTYLKHRHNHLLEKPFVCEICEKGFSTKFVLSNHERIHTGEKPYSCSFCNKKFAEKVNLTRHKRTHSGAKPYFCDLCRKGFSFKHNLTVHMRLHTKEKPFQCEVCNSRFPHSSDLKRHKKTHTREKPFSCDTCNKKFARKHYLIDHVRLHTNERPHACDICDKRFVSIYDCRKHLKVHMNHKNYHMGRKSRNAGRHLALDTRIS